MNVFSLLRSRSYCLYFIQEPSSGCRNMGWPLWCGFISFFIYCDYEKKCSNFYMIVVLNYYKAALNEKHQLDLRICCCLSERFAFLALLLKSNRSTSPLPLASLVHTSCVLRNTHRKGNRLIYGLIFISVIFPCLSWQVPSFLSSLFTPLLSSIHSLYPP